MEVGILEYRGVCEGPSPFGAAYTNRRRPQQGKHGGLHSQMSEQAEFVLPSGDAEGDCILGQGGSLRNRWARSFPDSQIRGLL